MSEETKEPTAESIIGTVIGAMLTLRPGKNHYTEEVAEVVVGQLGALRGLIESQSARIEELEKYRAFFFGCSGAPYDADNAETTDFVERGESLCDRIQELEAENAALKAAARAYIKAHSLTAVRLQDAEAADQYRKAAVSLEEMLDAE